ncbi:synaptotagmin-15 isoform X1 [Tribolium castaneum]|uniref:synaptotagmin-15 isoform X1 n=1 Tax=Tribolium castaneum TaxID=7070 RepID=UPI00046C2DA1|nr:PREDICTED: synaptotagmin-15 isoform X1 [Tribolium castaneum]XP_015838079.1 PREDICTED: synaptotagmin-15 isoform X1 [Tribolium castaneum]XP_972642.2 PREDICTED: synaptotagmin-15 isoform X1 [Tribolium castaneum]|eukprot:XP_015838078.1 PREDICTED: synaptotagmin-15 isoform X1 [Tribolium castaneum]
MENQSWTRKLLSTWRKDQQWYADKLAILRSVRSSEPPPGDIQSPPTGETFKEYVVSEQTPGELQRHEILYSSVAVGVVLLVFISAAVLFFLRRRKTKNADEEHAASSILVYPSQQGTAPQFLTKEIHFSLPPLRSTSLGDLTEPDDSDVDTESLLLPSVSNQRSNSFSCYGLGVIEPALYKSTLDLDEIQWPEGHIGRIWFSLRYEPSTEKLLVSLLKAKNLPSRTVGTVNSCDPFVRLHLMPDERRYLQSKQKKKTCNPYFDETLVFQVSQKDMSDHILKLTVIDGSRTKRRSEIGHVTFPLKDLEIGDGTEQQLFKLDLEKEPQEIKSNLGELLVSLLYNENLSRLTATVIEARGLKFQGDKHEAYVRLTLNQHYRSVKEKRTGVARPSRDGAVTFTEGFNFKLAPSQVDISSLAFHVFQATSGYGRDKLIGKCVLGSYMFARGKALIQWNTAIANPMEQSQQWHVLCE